MTKMVGIAEFKARCERLISEMERDGEPIHLTRRGKVVGVIRPPAAERSRRSLFGLMKGAITVRDDDIVGSINTDWEAQWNANNPPDLYDPHGGTGE